MHRGASCGRGRRENQLVKRLEVERSQEPPAACSSLAERAQPVHLHQSSSTASHPIAPSPRSHRDWTFLQRFAGAEPKELLEPALAHDPLCSPESLSSSQLTFPHLSGRYLRLIFNNHLLGAFSLDTFTSQSEPGGFLGLIYK